MARKSVHTVPNKEKGGWDNVVKGEKVSHHKTKEKAQDKGREIAIKQEAEHVIHKKDGTIGGSNTYGKNDPNPPKDKK